MKSGFLDKWMRDGLPPFNKNIPDRNPASGRFFRFDFNAGTLLVIWFRFSGKVTPTPAGPLHIRPTFVKPRPVILSFRCSVTLKACSACGENSGSLCSGSKTVSVTISRLRW